MSASFLIFDKTGEEGRRAGRLEKILKEKKFAVRVGEPSLTCAEDIVLAHNTNLSESTEKVLEELARLGRLIVVYTAGSITSRKENGIHYRLLIEIEQLIRLGNESWSVKDFEEAINLELASIRHKGFTTLAILAQCVSATVDNIPGARIRQKIWREDREQWVRVLESIPLAFLSYIAVENEKYNVSGLIDWIQGGEEIPNFVQAAVEAMDLSS